MGGLSSTTRWDLKEILNVIDTDYLHSRPIVIVK